MSRLQQDTFIDEEEDSCPLCVEEFDIQDKYFKPCPCGYQICQFCFNNIRTNLNGLCPACRRPYDDEGIVYKPISQEEMKAEENKKKRLQNERKKQEAQKREIEALNRKHLAGLRVIQRTLVYVTGINPNIPEGDLLQTLRKDEYFGQYGKIVKIVVNKRTTAQAASQQMGGSFSEQGIGVYVTFSTKEEAQRCIQCVDGVQNNDRMLRAAYGTTKYCSAYLRNETCSNRTCMFLHEPGEEAESFSRLELSNQNSRHTQSKAHVEPPPPPRQPVAAAALSHSNHSPPNNHDSTQMARLNSHTAAADHESSALPSTANWAKNPPTPASRPASLVHAISNPNAPKGSSPSPKVSAAAPNGPARAQDSTKNGTVREKEKPAPAAPAVATAPAASAAATAVAPAPAPAPSPAAPSTGPVNSVGVPRESQSVKATTSKPTLPPKPKERELPDYVIDQLQRWDGLAKKLSTSKFKFVFAQNEFSKDEYDALCKVPPMFDRQGGRRRREMLNRIEKMKAQALVESTQEGARPENTPQVPTGTAGTAGSQLGLPPIGMPPRGVTPPQMRDHFVPKEGAGQTQQPQGLGAYQQQQENIQQQQQQQQAAALRTQTPQSLLQQSNQHNFGAFQGGLSGLPAQSQPQQPGQAGMPTHTRQSSRYTFANDNPMASTTAVNARTNTAHMAEQIRMMPQQQQQQQQQMAQFYAGGVPGLGSGILGAAHQPPPGLKNAPTPPAPGLGGIPMGNFAGLSNQFSGLSTGAHNRENSKEQTLLRELMSANTGAAGLASAGGLLRSGDGKRKTPLPRGPPPGYANGRGIVDLADPSILQARVAPQQHQMQHHQGIPAGGIQGYNPPLNAYYGGGGRDVELRPPSQPADQDSKTQSAPAAQPSPARNATPGVSDKDFPALAPASTAKLATKPVIVPAIARKKDREKAKTQEKTAAGAGTAPSQSAPPKEPERPSGDASSRKTNAKSKQKPMLPPVDTSAPLVEKKGDKASGPALDGTASASRSSTASPAPQGQKSAPRMIRILSKGSDISTTSVKTPGTAGKSNLVFESATDDTASQTSSRPVSPPPPSSATRLTGPALADLPPVKVKSKSAIKKERRAAEKAKLEAETAEAVTIPGEVHAPVAARMKKKKAKKAGDAASITDGTTSGRQTPVPSVHEETEADEKEEPESAAQQMPPPKLQQSQQILKSTSSPAEQAPPEEEQKPANLTPAQIMQQLKEIDFSKLEMLKLPVSGLRSEHLSPEELQKIRTAQSVDPSKPSPGPPTVNIEAGAHTGTVQLSMRGGGTIETRMLVTPQGAALRGLTPEQEKRFLEMEARCANERPGERWGSGGGSSAIADLSTIIANTQNMPWRTAHTVAAGLASAGSAARNLHLGSDEAARLSTDEALSYLWHTVMPALPGYAREQLEGLAQTMAIGGCRVSVGFGDEPKVGEQCVTVDVKLEGGAAAGDSDTGLGSITAGKSVEELEKLVMASRKETEALEKKLEKLVKRNRKIVGLA